MICGKFHQGSGLGDQLFRYITVRTLAQEKGFDWYIAGEFKGKDFMHLLQIGGDKKEALLSKMKIWYEKDVRDAQGNDIRSYDPESQFVEDNTIIDGSFEDSKYWLHNIRDIGNWLEVEPLNVPDDLCIIGFRGGEYASNPDLFLNPEYYQEAMNRMYEINPDMKFEVHTDDPGLAVIFFTPLTKKETRIRYIENTPISHSKHTNMGFNWRSARYAKYAIIPNSAFFILPRMLKHHHANGVVTIAPRYWARHNTKVWARPACYYKEYTYI